MATQAFNALTGVSVGSNANVVIDANSNAFLANVSANFANFTGNVSANHFIGNGANITGNVNATYYLGDGGYLSNIGAALTVSQYTTGSLSNTVSNVSNLLFDTTTGIYVTNLGSNTALISLGSSFKTWQVAGQTSLVAVGEDTVEFVAGNNIVITTNAAATPQQIEFSLSDNITLTGNIVSGGDSNLGNSVTANFFIGDGGLLSNLSVGAGTYISSGNSNVRVFANSNVTTSVAGNANIVIVTGTGINVSGTLNTTGNANVGNLNIGSGAGGSLTGANSITANYFIGNGALLTGISTSPNSIFNGTSNVSIDTADGNVTVGINGTANVFVVANTGVTATYYNGDGNGISNIQGANVTGVVANANYAAYAGNAYSVDAANVVGLGNIATLNLDGNSSNVLYGNGVFSTAATGTGSSISNGTSNVNIAVADGNVTTSVNGNANVVVVTGTGINVSGTFNSTGNANVGNLSIGSGAGGSLTGANSITANYFVGNGSLLTGISLNTIINGTSNIEIPAANGNVVTTANGNSTLTITDIGANITGYANITGNLLAETAANVSLGNISNLHITGGTANQILSTDGAGTLSFKTGSITVVGRSGNISIPLILS